MSPRENRKDQLWRVTEVSGTPPPKTCLLCVRIQFLARECLVWDLESWRPSLPRLEVPGETSDMPANWERRFGKNHHRHRKAENYHCTRSIFSPWFVEWVRYMIGPCGLWVSFYIFINILKNTIYICEIFKYLLKVIIFNTYFTFVNSSCSAGY